MWQRNAVMVAVMACSAGSAGCVSKPVLELHSARVAGASTQGVRMDMVVRVNNNNAFDVRVRNVRAAVSIGGRYHLPQIRYNPDKWLGANQTTLVSVPVTIPWNMARPMLRTVTSPKITYTVKGHVDVTAVRWLGIRVNNYYIEDEGSLSRSQLVAVAARGF